MCAPRWEGAGGGRGGAGPNPNQTQLDAGSSVFTCGQYLGTTPHSALRPGARHRRLGSSNRRDYWAGARPNPGTRATGMAADRAPADIPWLAGLMANARP
jgi:hypothetical protein